MKKKLLIILASIFCFVVLVIYFIKPSNHVNQEKMEGDIIYKQGEEINVENSYDEEWIAADAELGDNYNLLINNPDGCLSTYGFLTIKGHMTKCEAIYDFLKENGYQEESVTVISDTAIHKGNNSYFCVSLDSYPDVVLEIAFYGITEEFAFSIIK